MGGVRLAMSADSDFVWSRVYTCLAAVSCHLHFWQNDRDLLRATAVTRRWNGYRNKSQHRKLTLEKIAVPPLLLGIEPANFRSRDPRDDFFRRAAFWSLGLVWRRVVPEDVLLGSDIPGGLCVCVCVGGGGERLYPTLRCHLQNDSCLKPVLNWANVSSRT